MTASPQHEYDPELMAQYARPHYVNSSPVYNRGLKEYNHMFRCELQTLFAGQRILDLGSGSRGALAQGLAATDVEVVSLSPNCLRFKDLDLSILPVAGIVQQLPFRDRSFAGVVASWSIPMYLPKDKMHYAAALHEVWRVLDEDGLAMFGPISDRSEIYVRQAIDSGFDPALFRFSCPGVNPILLLAKHPNVFEMPGIAQLRDCATDPQWEQNNPDPWLACYLEGQEALASVTPVRTLQFGQWVINGASATDGD